MAENAFGIHRTWNQNARNSENRVERSLCKSSLIKHNSLEFSICNRNICLLLCDCLLFVSGKIGESSMKYELLLFWLKSEAPRCYVKLFCFEKDALFFCVKSEEWICAKVFKEVRWKGPSDSSIRPFSKCIGNLHCTWAYNDRRKCLTPIHHHTWIVASVIEWIWYSIAAATVAASQPAICELIAKTKLTHIQTRARGRTHAQKRPGVFHRHTKKNSVDCQCENSSSSDDDVLRLRPNNEIRALLVLYKSLTFSYIFLFLSISVFTFLCGGFWKFGFVVFADIKIKSSNKFAFDKTNRPNIVIFGVFIWCGVWNSRDLFNIDRFLSKKKRTNVSKRTVQNIWLWSQWKKKNYMYSYKIHQWVQPVGATTMKKNTQKNKNYITKANCFENIHYISRLCILGFSNFFYYYYFSAYFCDINFKRVGSYLKLWLLGLFTSLSLSRSIGVECIHKFGCFFFHSLN